MSSKLVLVLNCGSSSLKFAIIDALNGDEYLSGLAECFHLPEARQLSRQFWFLCQNSVNDKVQRFTVSGACT